jgi:hypothetical protein
VEERLFSLCKSRFAWNASVKDRSSMVAYVASWTPADCIELAIARREPKWLALREGLDIQVLHVERVIFDEFAAGFDVLAHQR